MDQREYYEECKSIAQEALNEQSVKTSDDYEEKRDEVMESMEQSIDSHSFLIYTDHVYAVLQITSNTDAYEDVGIELDASKGFDHIATQVAYWAMRQDVQECLDELVEELPEASEENEEEEEEIANTAKEQVS
jgi:hypothetical protein